MNKVICVQCREYVEYDIKEIEQKTTIKKEEIVYKEKIAYCKECGEEVWVEKLEEENVLEPINVYCERKGLISPRQINQLLNKYNIGKRPLAQLLGWGDITITRFLEGQLPSTEYSNRLLDLLNNPKKFKIALTKNKGKITKVAFSKATKALEQLKESKAILESFESIYKCQIGISYRTNGNRKEGRTLWGLKSCYC